MFNQRLLIFVTTLFALFVIISCLSGSPDRNRGKSSQTTLSRDSWGEVIKARHAFCEGDFLQASSILQYLLNQQEVKPDSCHVYLQACEYVKQDANESLGFSERSDNKKITKDQMSALSYFYAGISQSTKRETLSIREIWPFPQQVVLKIPVVRDIKKADQFLNHAQEKIEKAGLILAQKPNDQQAQRDKLVGEIQSVAWTLLLAEQLTASDFSFHVTAQQHFENGFSLLKKLQQVLEKQPVVEDLFVNAPYALAQFDTVQFRTKIYTAAYQQNAQSLARRIENLQKIALSYREIASDVILAHRDFQFGQDIAAEERFSQATAQISKIDDVLKQSRTDKFFLRLEPEISTLDDPPDSTPFPAFQSGFEEHMLVVSLMAQLNRAKTMERAEALQKLEAIAEQLDRHLAQFANNPDLLASRAMTQTIKGYVHEEMGLQVVSKEITNLDSRAIAKNHFNTAQASLQKALDDYDELERSMDPVVRLTDRFFVICANLQEDQSGWGQLLSFIQPSFSFNTVNCSQAVLLKPAPMLAQIKRKYEQLSNVEQFLTRANNDLIHDPGTALVLLEKGVSRHDDEKLWIEYLRAWYRSGLRPEELKQMLDSCLPASEQQPAIFQWTNPEPLILRATLKLDTIRKDLKHDPRLFDIDQQDLTGDILREMLMRHAALSGQCNEAIADLKRALELLDLSVLPNSAIKKSRCQALLVQGIAIRGLVNENQNSDLSTELHDAYATAKTTRDQLTAQTSNSTRIETLEELQNTEALIAVLFAHGFLALQIELPSQPATKEAAAAFAAALDRQASLPYDRPGMRITGTPLIRLLLSRGGLKSNSSSKDRFARETLGYFVDGAFSMSFGNAKNTEVQMQQGMSVLETEKNYSATGEPSLIDALSLLNHEASSSLKYFSELMASYHLLAKLDSINFEKQKQKLTNAEQLQYAKQSHEILTLALSLVPTIPDDQAKQLTMATIKKGSQDFRSPFVGLVLARAMEARAIHLGLGMTSEKQALLEYARSTLRKVDQMMDNETKRRFSLFNTQREEIYRRLSQPDYYLEKIKNHQEKFQLSEGIRVAMTGLRRHSRSNAMWKALYNLKSTQARLLSDPLQRRQAYEEILLFNELWNANVLVQQSDRLVRMAEVHEKLGQWDIGNRSRGIDWSFQVLGNLRSFANEPITVSTF